MLSSSLPPWFKAVSARSGWELLPLSVMWTHSQSLATWSSSAMRAPPPPSNVFWVTWASWHFWAWWLPFWPGGSQTLSMRPKWSLSGCWFPVACGSVSYPPTWAPKAEPWWLWSPSQSWLPALAYWGVYSFPSAMWSSWDQEAIQGRNYMSKFPL